MKYFKHFAHLTIVGVLISTLALLGAPTKLPAAELPPIKIGITDGITGFMAPDALAAIMGVELKLNEVGYQVAGGRYNSSRKTGPPM